MADEIVTNETSFAGRFRAAMEQRGLTQRSVADALGLESATQISHWATGRRRPNSQNLMQLCDVLGVELAWLRGEPDGDALASKLRSGSGPLGTFGEASGLSEGSADTLREIVALGAEGLTQTEEADYLRLMAFVFLAGAWNKEHGWRVEITADVGNGRVIVVKPEDVTLNEYSRQEGPEPPTTELERELEAEAQRLEEQRAADAEAKPARARRGRAS